MAHPLLLYRRMIQARGLIICHAVRCSLSVVVVPLNRAMNATWEALIHLSSMSHFFSLSPHVDPHSL
jgi:hypothetical protein